MIRRHIDLLAIGALLFGISLLAEAKKSVVIGQQSLQVLGLSSRHLQQVTIEPYIPQFRLRRN